MFGFVGSAFGGVAVRSQEPQVAKSVSRAQARRGMTVRAMQTGASQVDGVRVGPPPDLPSLLLHNRIVYVGMALVPAVTELLIAELLYLQFEDPDKPVYMYINSTGTTNAEGANVGFETEAFALVDTMNYIKPPIHTICVGQAYGMAAMVLAAGEKGQRAALPNATIMLHQPRSMARGQASDIAIKAKEVLSNRREAFTIIADAAGQPPEKVYDDAQRTKYMSPEQALEYGVIDKVLESTKDLPAQAPSFMGALG